VSETPFSLKGKVALVTGAATGLGAASAVALAEAGADMVITDRPEVSLDETVGKVSKYNLNVFKVPMDVRYISQIKHGIKASIDHFGRIDILLNNAGINRPAAGLDVTVSEWDDHYNTNVRGGFFTAQAVAPGMMERGWGRIIFISSQSGLVGISGQPVYCSTKGAIIQLVRTLGVEWAKYGLTVNSIAPTFIETNMTRKRLQNPEFLNYVLGMIPLGKLALPEHIAAAVVFLASEEAAMVNATTLSVDGGWTAW
jgi:NAD(P)-dependent dehydrogenase (short-subunit alcohol dehydrogenase family)